MILLGIDLVADIVSGQVRTVSRTLVDRATGMVGVVAILGMATALAIPRRR